MLPVPLLLVLAACSDALGPGTIVTPRSDDTRLPAAMRAAYEEDAAQLALRSMLAAGDSATIAIPADEVAARYAALVRVYNAPFPARDSVVEIYDIHTFGRPPAHDLMVGVEWTAAWKDAWQRGERLTGNAGIDALMETWDLEVRQYLELTAPPYDLALLRSAAPVNTIGLAMQFRALEGVASASPDWLIGDGDDIRATRDSAAWVLAFSLGYGDCPAGCTGRTVWTFSVFDDGRVRYDGSKVSGLPGPIPVP